MAYLNNIYGNAAYTGFYCGQAAAAGSGIHDTTAADYLILKTTSLTLAVAVDALITFDALVTTGSAITQLAITTNTIAANEQWRAGLLHSLCFGAVQGRVFTAAGATAGATALAAGIFAAWTEGLVGLVVP